MVIVQIYGIHKAINQLLPIRLYRHIELWDTIFFDPTKPYQDESGILPELLKEKYMDTRDQEVYGVLMFLCTVSAISNTKDKYLCWLGQAYKRLYSEVLLDIARTMDELSGAAQYMLEELDNQ